METQTEIALYVETCISCGVTFAFTRGFYDQRQRDGNSFHCPNGHSQYYSNNDKQKLKEAQRLAETAKADAKWWKDQAESKGRSLIATRGQITKLKNRVAAGKCIYCNKKFEDLHDHMVDKHPEHVEEVVNEPVQTQS